MGYVNTNCVMAVGILFVITSISSVAARFYVRITTRQGLGPDDWLTIPAMMLVIAMSCIMIAGSATNSIGSNSPPNLGLEFADHMDAAQRLMSKFETAFDLIQTVSLALIKISILFFYRRIFRGPIFNYISLGLAGFIAICSLTFFIAIAAACGTDFAANWETIATLKEKCANTFDILICFSVFDAAQDLALLIVPIPLVLKLHMPTSRKFAVLGVLLVGTLAIACSFTRMVLWGEILGPQLLTDPTVGGVPSDDDIGVVSMLMFWSMLENGIAMIASCLPTLRPLFHGFSAESVINSVRSAISLHSLGSRGSRNKSNFSKGDPISESEIAIAHASRPSDSASNPQKHDWNPLSTVDVEAYAMGKISGNSSEIADHKIMRETQITQTYRDVSK